MDKTELTKALEVMIERFGHDTLTAHGVGENMGYVCDKRNTDIAIKLRKAFSEWYSNGHINESDPNTIILCIRLTDAVLFSHGTRYDIDFNAI